VPLPKELTTITPLSKAAAMLLFILLPFLGFFLGIRYQEAVDQVDKLQHQNLYIGLSNSLSLTQAQKFAPKDIKKQLPPSYLSETESWKTYTNKAYNFSIKYPEYLTVKEQGGNNISFVDERANAYKKMYYHIITDSNRNFKEIYNAPFGSEMKGEELNNNDRFYQNGAAILDNLNGVYFVYYPTGNSSPNDIAGLLIERNGKIIEISQDRETIGLDFDIFVATFKFTD